MNSLKCQCNGESEIQWVCLTRDCDNRLLCNVCAVKNHPKNHQLEEINHVRKIGIKNSLLNIFPIQQEDDSQQEQNETSIDDIEKEINNHIEEITKQYKEYLYRSLETIKFLQQKIEADMKQIKNQKIIEKNNVEQKVTYLQTEAFTKEDFEDVQSNLNEAISLTYENILTGESFEEQQTKKVQENQRHFLKNTFSLLLNVNHKLFNNKFVYSIFYLFDRYSSEIKNMVCDQNYDHEVNQMLNQLDYRLSQDYNGMMNKISVNLDQQFSQTQPVVQQIIQQPQIIHSHYQVEPIPQQPYHPQNIHFHQHQQQPQRQVPQQQPLQKKPQLNIRNSNLRLREQNLNFSKLNFNQSQIPRNANQQRDEKVRQLMKTPKIPPSSNEPLSPIDIY